VTFNGTPRYISSKVKFDNFDRVELGERAVISQDVIFLTHDYSFTTGLISIGKCPPTDMAFLRSISLGKNVFIGMSSILLPGTQIGDNVVVGAGSVVRGMIPSDSIVIGNPGKVIGKLSEKAKLWESGLKNMEMRVD
jgi:acetyltransferase-like isoleucine patch superfamily enzyme